ncbi:MAG: cupin [Methylophaga sp.]|nr:MAG: cupin [Methylophaga sp.]
MTQFLNTDLTQQQFLDQYWQKKPLLIRQAFVDFESPISPDDLAGLACEAEIESRLIEEKGQDSAWQVTNGPLSEKDFSRLPPTHWTLLVQDVDKHLPELQYLLDPFRFIPDWRRDDLMISYAPEFGTVGPHTDSYDVFLLQAKGMRRWQIMDKPIQNAKLMDGLELQILTAFSADQTWDLQPGDILYLPPHFAHHGVALNDGMTYSIGFRAPRSVDMLDAVVNGLLEQGLGQRRYHDPDLKLVQHNSEIDQAAVERLTQMLHRAIDEAEPILASALGKFVTETKSSLTIFSEESMDDLPSIEMVTEKFSLKSTLQRNVYHRFAWTRHETGGQLFMAGESYNVDITGVSNLAMLSDHNVLTEADWHYLLNDEQSANLLCQLIADGGWIWQSKSD